MNTRYKIITGEFWIHYPDMPRQGPQPDGDTITFKPDNRSLVTGLKRFGPIWPHFNKRGTIPVRFEGIDALETHFNGAHQDLELADRARDFMLAEIGFQDVVFWDDLPNVVKSVSNNPLKGYIVANGIDSNGRVIGFVYPGKPKEKDGKQIFLNDTMMLNSVNAAILTEGLAYAAIYTSLPIDLISALRKKTHAIRAKGLGVFGRESFDTKRSARIEGFDEIEQMVMWPKLFRRMASFFSSGGSKLSDLIDWLRADIINRDDRLQLPNGELGNLHDLIAIDSESIRMQYNSEDVIVLPDNT
jgi:hypothetical protein